MTLFYLFMFISTGTPSYASNSMHLAPVVKCSRIEDRSELKQVCLKKDQTKNRDLLLVTAASGTLYTFRLEITKDEDGVAHQNKFTGTLIGINDSIDEGSDTILIENGKLRYNAANRNIMLVFSTNQKGEELGITFSFSGVLFPIQ